MVTYYHTELVQMIIELELDDLSISDYSCTFDDSYSLLKSIITDQFTDYLLIFGSLQRAFINLSHDWLILSKEWLFVLASADFRSTCDYLILHFDTYR